MFFIDFSLFLLKWMSWSKMIVNNATLTWMDAPPISERSFKQSCQGTFERLRCHQNTTSSRTVCVWSADSVGFSPQILPCCPREELVLEAAFRGSGWRDGAEWDIHKNMPFDGAKWLKIIEALRRKKQTSNPLRAVKLVCSISALFPLYTWHIWRAQHLATLWNSVGHFLSPNQSSGLFVSRFAALLCSWCAALSTKPQIVKSR